jgi:hypothetical protein
VKKLKKVSVIVPVYNVEKYLEKCLDSLINQTLEDIEIIVVNDGSPDNSQLIIDKYSKKYPNIIKSYIKENGGLSDARNYGIEKASGNYIGFVDSDDYVDRQMFEKMYNKAIKDNLDIVVCDTINVYPDGHEEIRKSNLEYSNNDIKNYIIAPPMACMRLCNKKIFKDNKFKKGILYEDLEFTPSLVSLTNKIGFVNEGLYYYLQREGSIMKQSKFNDKQLDIFSVLEKNRKYLYNDYKEEVEYLYITHLLRSATLRFLEYGDAEKYLHKINDTMKKYFPNWHENKYLKKSSKKLKLICYLAYHKNYKTIKLIKKITNK